MKNKRDNIVQENMDGLVKLKSSGKFAMDLQSLRLSLTVLAMDLPSLRIHDQSKQFCQTSDARAHLVCTQKVLPNAVVAINVCVHEAPLASRPIV